MLYPLPRVKAEQKTASGYPSKLRSIEKKSPYLANRCSFGIIVHLAEYHCLYLVEMHRPLKSLPSPPAPSQQVEGSPGEKCQAGPSFPSQEQMGPEASGLRSQWINTFLLLQPRLRLLGKSSLGLLFFLRSFAFWVFWGVFFSPS